jgi:hypothetical protein
VGAALALDAERRLGLEPGAEALERGDGVLILYSEFLSRLGRVDRALEVDLVRSVGDPKPESRRRQSSRSYTLRRRVLDEHAHVGAPVELRQVEDDLLVHAGAASGSDSRGGTPQCVLRQVGHGVPPLEELRSWG